MLRIVGCCIAVAWACLSARAGDWYEAPPVPNTFILNALELQPAAPPGSSAFVRLDIASDGTQSVVVRVLGLPAGSYDVFKDPPGELLGSLDVDATGMGQLAPEPPGGFSAAFLEWFKFSDNVEVRQDATVLFAGSLQPPGGWVLLDDAVSCVNGARLIAVGDDFDARGRVVYRSSYGGQRVDVLIDRLDPGPYVLDIGGVPSLLLDVGASGKARLRECVPVKPGFGATTVDTVGEEIRVRNAAGEVVLAARMPYDPYEEWSRGLGRQKFKDVGDGAADGLRVDFLEYGYVGYGGLDRGWLAWARDATGAATISVKISGQDFTPADPYGIYVDDQLIGTVGEYISDEDDPLANSFPVGPEVDLRLKRVEVRDGKEVGLVLTFPRSVPAGTWSYRREVRKPKLLRLDLLNPGIDLDARGTLRWRRAGSGVERLTLSAQDLPAGAYDLAVGGSVVASGVLVISEAGGSAVAYFSTLGDPALPLDFAVDGALEIRASGTDTVFLQQSLEH